MLTKFWHILPPTPDLARTIAKDFSLTEVLAQLLVHRGLQDPARIQGFLNPRLADLTDPFLLPDMDKATSRIFQAIAAKQKIVVFGDYDVDGMTSIALLLEVLGALGAQCGYFLPSRFTDGYGLSQDALKRCIQDGAKLIISVDCGTNSSQEILYAKSQGVDFIVLDHHEHNGEPFEAVAVVNPKRADSHYKEELASVGIAFKLSHALLKSLRAQRSNLVGDSTAFSPPPLRGRVRVGGDDIDLKSLLDLVAIGTIGDMVPLLGENRILVKAGLTQLAQTTRPGLKILRDLAGIREIPSATDVAFRIAPRLNANGRLADAQDALGLLRTKSEIEAMALAQKLHQQNQRRQQIEKQISQEAIALIASKSDYQLDPVLVLYNPAWHIGVVGIVANKLVKHFGKPAIVIGTESGMGKGSARAPEGFNITEALAAASAHLVTSGGHAAAAGLTIEPSRLEAFRKEINTVARKILDQTPIPNQLHLDMEVSKDQLNAGLIEQLQSLEPFGMGNPRPVFATRRIAVEGPPTVVGSSHLKFQTRIAETLFDVIGFRMAQERSAQSFAELTGRKIDIAYHPGINTFNGQSRLQLTLEDYHYSQ